MKTTGQTPEQIIGKLREVEVVLPTGGTVALACKQIGVTVRSRLIKIGAKGVKHARYTCFQIAEVLITRNLLAAVFGGVRRLMQPVPV